MPTLTINQITSQALTEQHFSLLLNADPSRNQINQYIYDSLIFELHHQGKLSGIAILREKGDRAIEIMNIAIDEAHQRQGLGKKLIHYLIDYAKNAKYCEIWISTGNSSLHQLALYQKCGFQQRAIIIDFFTQHYPKEIYENGILCTDLIQLSITF